MSERDTARAEMAQECYLGGLAELMANLLRIGRGNGHPSQIANQLKYCTDALDDYRDASGNVYPHTGYHDALGWEDEGRDTSFLKASFDTILNEAAQTIASRVLDQRGLMAKAENRTHDAMRQYERDIEDWKSSR